MSKKIINIFKMIKSNKRYKYTLVVTIMILFISIIGYFLSIFSHNAFGLVANIKVNDLLFNVTSNSGESNDRVLKLSSNSTEMFNAIILNLNKIDVKYEVTYKVCTSVDCTSFYENIPDGISLKLNDIKDNVSSGVISPGSSNYKSINIITINKTDNDYYILLDLNAGYLWNDLELANMFGTIDEPINVNDITTDIIAYVDGVSVSNYPATCNYVAKVYKVVNEQEIELSNSELYCDRKTNTWKMTTVGFYDKLVIKFIYQAWAPTITYTGEYEFVDENSSEWKIRFLTSGTLTFVDEVMPIDVFLVGGGAGGGGPYVGDEGKSRGGGSGGPGYNNTVKNVSVTVGTEYNIVIGAGGTAGGYSKAGTNGGVTSAFGESVNGGVKGGAGGWGIAGSNGAGGDTANEFGSDTVTAITYSNRSGDAIANTGNSGKGSSIFVGSDAGDGQSGIVIIRNHIE